MSQTTTRNVPQPAKYKQVVVWPGAFVSKRKGRPVSKKSIKEFEAFIASTFNGTRAQYLEEIQTGPDVVRGYPVPETGGRNDVFFAVHTDDIGKFAVPRLAYHMRWIEDVLDNEKHHNDGVSLYPQRVVKYRTW